MNVGLFGGTFDPVHVGHLDVAKAARLALGLDQVWFVPTRHPPHRSAPRASAAHRFAMVALAITEEDGLLVSDLEMDAAGPTYTIDTCRRVMQQHPAWGPPLFVVGADAFLEIRTWRAWEELVDRCHFAVVSRPGCPVSTLRTALPDLVLRMHETPSRRHGTAPGIFLVDAATAEVSSTDVRRAVMTGRSPAGLVPPSVAAYAFRHGLYRDAGPREPGNE